MGIEYKLMNGKKRKNSDAITPNIPIITIRWKTKLGTISNKNI
jgi:hypothetical protein